MGISISSNPKIIYVQAGTPADVTAGMLWYDTSENSLKVSNGSSYIAIGEGNSALNGILGVTTGDYTVEPTDLLNATDGDTTTTTGTATIVESNQTSSIIWDIGSVGNYTVLKLKQTGSSSTSEWGALNCKWYTSIDGSSWNLITDITSEIENSSDWELDKAVLLTSLQGKVRYLKVDTKGYLGQTITLAINEVELY